MLANATNLGQLAAALRRTADDLTKLPEDPATLKAVADVGLAGMRRHFDQGKGPDGAAWPPPKLRDGKPLVDRGRLKAGGRASVESKRVVLANVAPYASVHQDGLVIQASRAEYLAIPVKRGSGGIVKKKRVVIPRRMHVGWAAETLNEVMELLAKKVQEKV